MAQDSARRGHRSRPPVLVIELELEQPGRFFFCAETCEDERRLRLWLARSKVWAALPRLAERLLDDLDDYDAGPFEPREIA